jgi:hypothetical protein
MPDTAATPPALVDSRHEVMHIRLLAFRDGTGDDHA